MDGAIQRFDCAPCRTTWYRHAGTSTVCPGCGADMTATDEPFVALEVMDPEAAETGPPATAGDDPRTV